jgi:hypothetical protein
MNKVLDGCRTPRMIFEVCAKYIRLHSEKIFQECLMETTRGKQSRNLFLPISLGGMGVLMPLGWHGIVTTFQKKLMKSLMMVDRRLISIEYDQIEVDWGLYDLSFEDSREPLSVRSCSLDQFLDDENDPFPIYYGPGFGPVRLERECRVVRSAHPSMSVSSVPTGYPLRLLPGEVNPWNVQSLVPESMDPYRVDCGTRLNLVFADCSFRFPNKSTFAG